MINSLCILFSLVMVVYVVVRASLLDARRPWFEIAVPDAPRPDATPAASRQNKSPRR